MNRNLLLAIFAALVVGGGAYFVISNRTRVTTSPQQNQTQTTQGAQQKSLKDLFSMGVSQQCTFGDENGSGTVYTAGGKMRGDFSSKTNNQTRLSHMITQGQTSYVWVDGEKSGFKMTFDASTQAEAGADAQKQAMDVDKKVDVKCSAWVVNSSVFTVPADVTFTDFGSMMMPTGSNSDTNNNDAKCAACNNVPEESKAQCKAALGCK